MAMHTGSMNLLAEAISSRYRNVETVQHIIDLIETHIVEPQEVRITSSSYFLHA